MSMGDLSPISREWLQEKPYSGTAVLLGGYTSKKKKKITPLSNMIIHLSNVAKGLCVILLHACIRIAMGVGDVVYIGVSHSLK